MNTKQIDLPKSLKDCDKNNLELTDTETPNFKDKVDPPTIADHEMVLEEIHFKQLSVDIQSAYYDSPDEYENIPVIPLERRNVSKLVSQGPVQKRKAKKNRKKINKRKKLLQIRNACNLSTKNDQ